MKRLVSLTLILLVVSLCPAWDVELVRSWSLGSHGMSATGIFDIDGDAVPELLVPGNSRLYCYDTAGSLRWSFLPISNYFPAVSSPLAADINHDGQIEILFSTPAAVYCLGPGGDSIWRCLLGGQGSVQNCISSVALADVNNDNLLEVFAYEVYANRLLCLKPRDGTISWSYLPGGNTYFSVGTPTVADLDLDGRLEVLGQVAFNGGGGQLYCLDALGQELWHYNTPGSGIGGWQLASAAVADLNGDDSLEVVTTANYWGIVCLSAQGRELWRRSLSQHAATYPAIGDLDQDDSLEIVVALGSTMRCLRGRTGTDKWTFTVDSGYYIVSSPALADLDGDDSLEVIFAEVKQNNPTDPNRPLWILDCHGNPLWHDTVGTTMSDPTCADLNRDGKMEILIGPTLRSGNFYWFQVDTTAVPVAASPWPTLQHDIWRTGWFDWTPPVGVRTPTGLPVRHSEALLATPNPFTRQVTICARSGKRLSVFDPAGRKVTELNLSGGSTTWDASRLTPGIYFGRLENGAALRLVKLGE